MVGGGGGGGGGGIEIVGLSTGQSTGYRVPRFKWVQGCGWVW